MSTSYPYMALAEKWNIPYRDVLLYSDWLEDRVTNRILSADAVDRTQETLTALTIEFEEDMHEAARLRR